MYNPLSTYRIQFNKNFTFKDFKDALAYFSQLNVGTIYASPVFKSTPGSIHGYDVTDPHIFNPEIGNENEFDEILTRLKEHNIGWIQDIVPNHMAFHHDNHWLMDVLRKGSESPFASYFDINFSHPDFKGKLIIPFLGKTLQEALQEGEIKLDFRDNNLGFIYYDFFFPVSEPTEMEIFKNNMEPKEEILNRINSDPSKLEALLDKQHYLLTHWKEASQHLNYRRFFTINSLISLAMENDKVFDAYHTFILNLVKDKKINGLRIDHIDGLKKPGRYIEKLRASAGDETYIVAEKILRRDEQVPQDWPLEGTTGYDFLGIVNNLFTYKKNFPQLKQFYQEFTGIEESPQEIIYQKKKLILMTYKLGDLENLCRMFEEENFVDGKDPLITHESIKSAIAEFLVCFPRYRSYSWYFPLSDEDKNIIKKVLLRAEAKSPLLKKTLDVIQNLLIDQKGLSQKQKEAALQFFLRCMQYSGPLMAKGVEDTVMYYYNCFIAHNEVGDEVDASGISIQEFHEIMKNRRNTLPLTQNATSTHDTKRGEDIRARLNVISEMSLEWIKMVNVWHESNQHYKTLVNDEKGPSLNEEYFIYQSLTGVMPFNQEINESLQKRLDEYLVKSLREAKINTNWNEPNKAYEKAVLNFLKCILEPNSEFLKSFLPFQKKIARYGIFNSLTQLFLKATCPGIPDFYQGTELWDLSLVDPDNRRPVDYQLRADILKNLVREHKEDSISFHKNLFHNPENGYLKLWFTRMLMKERALHPNLFTYGLYLPLKVTGNYKEHILAFARVYNDTWYMIIVPLYLSLLHEKPCSDSESLCIEWEDTTVEIPDLAPEKWSFIPKVEIINPERKILISSIMEVPFPCFLKGTKEKTVGKAGGSSWT